MNAVTVADVNAAVLNTLELAYKFGSSVGPRGYQTRELWPYTVQILNPSRNILDMPARKINYHFMVAEMLWILSGCDETDILAAFAPFVTKWYDPGQTFGAYGPRFRHQLAHVLQSLRADPESRQAVMTMWRPEIRVQKTVDTPCTVMFHFLIREDRLNMITYMRSNDCWLGLPYDLYNFTQIMNYVAGLLGKDVGIYTHTVGSMHLYERDIPAAERLMEALQGDPGRSQSSMPMDTPCPIDRQILQRLGKLAEGDADGFNPYMGYDRPWRGLMGVLAHKRTGILGRWIDEPGLHDVMKLTAEEL